MPSLQRKGKKFKGPRNVVHCGAGAKATCMFSDTSETGPGAAPELTSSTIARRGLILCFSHRSGKNTPAPALHQRKLHFCFMLI